MRGYWNMHCWNGLGPLQQQRLIEHGNLPLGFVPMGTCQRPAELEIETMYDDAPGPRFYCVACAIEYLESLVTIEIGVYDAAHYQTIVIHAAPHEMTVSSGWYLINAALAQAMERGVDLTHAVMQAREVMPPV